MDIEKTGGFIRTLRTEKNMTQKDLAEKLGCTDKAISRWETGKGLPDASLLLPLSDLLGISVNELLNGERFLIADLDKSEKENKEEDTMSVPELITKADETIVEIIKDKDTEIKKLNKTTVVFFVLCFLQTVIFFGLPQIIGMIFPTFEPVVLLVYATVAIAVLVGLLNSKIKWLYPIFTAALLLFAAPFAGSDDWLYGVLALYFLAGTLAIVGACSVIRLAAKKLKKRFG